MALSPELSRLSERLKRSALMRTLLDHKAAVASKAAELNAAGEALERHRKGIVTALEDVNRTSAELSTLRALQTTLEAQASVPLAELAPEPEPEPEPEGTARAQ